MALILHIETATKVCSVAISKDGEQIALKEVKEDGYSHGEKLTLFIEEAMRQASLNMKDLDAVSVTSGPGSYTGLRIGAATAKGLCYALQIPLIAIDSLTSLCYLAKEKNPNVNLCAVIDARRMEVYNLFLDENLNGLKEISADIIEENSYKEFEPFVCFGDGASKLQEVWGERECSFDLTIDSSAKGHIELAHQKYTEEQFEDVAYWEPFYLKDFIAGKKSSK